MELKRELLVTVGVLVGLNLLLAFGVIALFVRMGPAIERILQENVYSIIAAEEMLAAFASSDGQAIPETEAARVFAALDRARNNVTEDSEWPILRVVESRLDDAIRGSAPARVAVVESIRSLITVNRAAMQAVDEEARRLGRAGAWSAVFIGFLSFVVSLVILARLRGRFVLPLADLHRVLTSARDGEMHRRCAYHAAPVEVRQVVAAVNELLDARLEEQNARRQADPAAPAMNSAMTLLLGRVESPAMVVNAEGEIVRANPGALDMLAGDRGPSLKETLRSFVNGESPDLDTLRCEPLAGSTGWLCTVGPAR